MTKEDILRKIHEYESRQENLAFQDNVSQDYNSAILAIKSACNTNSGKEIVTDLENNLSDIESLVHEIGTVIQSVKSARIIAKFNEFTHTEVLK